MLVGSKTLKNQCGVTLVEALVSTAILAIIMSGTFAFFTNSARQTIYQNESKSFNDLIDSFRSYGEGMTAEFQFASITGSGAGGIPVDIPLLTGSTTVAGNNPPVVMIQGEFEGQEVSCPSGNPPVPTSLFLPLPTEQDLMDLQAQGGELAVAILNQSIAQIGNLTAATACVCVPENFVGAPTAAGGSLVEYAFRLEQAVAGSSVCQSSNGPIPPGAVAEVPPVGSPVAP